MQRGPHDTIRNNKELGKNKELKAHIIGEGGAPVMKTVAPLKAERTDTNWCTASAGCLVQGGATIPSRSVASFAICIPFLSALHHQARCTYFALIAGQNLTASINTGKGWNQHCGILTVLICAYDIRSCHINEMKYKGKMSWWL